MLYAWIIVGYCGAWGFGFLTACLFRGARDEPGRPIPVSRCQPANSITRHQIAERIVALADEIHADDPYTEANLCTVAGALLEGQELALNAVLADFAARRTAALQAINN